MNTLKFQIYNGSSFGDAIYFDSKEVGFFRRVPANEFNLIKPNYNKPIAFDTSKLSSETSTRERWIFTFEIIHMFGTTKSKIKSLVDAGYKIRVFYEYKITPAEYKDCILSKSYKESYIYGSEEALIKTSLVFKGEVA